MRISDWSSDVCSSDPEQAPYARDHRRRKGDVDRDRDRATVHEGREAPVREHPWPQPALDELPGDEGQEQDRNDAQHRFAMDITRVACRSEEHTSELQSLMRISYAVFCLKKKIITQPIHYRAR